MPYFLYILAFLLVVPAYAAPICKSRHLEGQECWVKIKDLSPTQSAVGVLDVKEQMKEIDALSKSGLKDYLKENIIHIVIGPGDKFYLVDGHHHARAMWEVGHKKMRAEVIGNYADLSESDFLARMKKEGRIRLVDENGKPLKKITDLPSSVSKLKDDPYRSLAWLLRKSGAIRKTKIPFAEFYWADFLRDQVKIGKGKSGMEKAFQESITLMAETNCSKLPGYVRRHASACPQGFHLECWQAFKALKAH